MQNSSLYTMTPLLQPDSNATIHQTTRFSNCMQDTNKLHKCLNSLLQLNIFKNTYNTHQKMQNSSLYTIKDSSATRFKCYNTSNDKIQQLYAVTNKLHKCLNFLLELNIFKNTNNTHQNQIQMLQNIKRQVSATVCRTNELHKCLNSFFEKHKQHTSTAEFIALLQFCNQIQMLQYIKRQDSATVCRHEHTHKCLNFFATIKHFQKHIQHTSKDAEFIALHDQGQFCKQIQMLQCKIQQLMQTRTNS